MLFKNVLTFIISAVLLTACSIFDASESWPRPLPAKKYFESYYQSSVENHPYQSLDDYLNWVKIFYQGNALAPGWLQLTDEVLQEIPANKKSAYEIRMQALGQRIGAEWSLDNGVRLIDTRSASVWSDALLEAIAMNELENFIARMEEDVDNILMGSLNKDEIAFTRYYDAEELEFF